jgi:Catalase
MAGKRQGAKTKNKQFADAAVTLGTGGETHQTADADVPILTTQQGIPVADDQNSLKIGARGPTVLEDFHLREKILHFDHERIPERVVHLPADRAYDSRGSSPARCAHRVHALQDPSHPGSCVLPVGWHQGSRFGCGE